MRNLLLAAILPMAMLSGGAAFGGTDYRLDIGDKLKVKVFDWRAATGDVHEWNALGGEYDIGADGQISLPLVGGLKATGLTTDALAESISSRLQDRLGLTIRPQASIEIVEYRPFYILGDVSKPGEYSYRPQLTVLQAISLAGGRYRVSDAALVVSASGDLRVLRLQYSQLLARRARLQAELSDASTMTIPPELQRQQSDPFVAQLIQREQATFAAHRDAAASELNALNQLKSLLNGEVASLQDKMKNVDQELGLRKQELNSTTSLVQQGLAVAPREYSLRETELEAEGRRLDLDTASLRAKEEVGKTEQSIVQLQNKTHSQVRVELAEVEQKIPETAARIANAMAVTGSRQAGASSANDGGATEELPATCVIERLSDGKPTRIDGDESTRVEPGDTIKILRSGPAFPIEASNTPPAADPTEHADGARLVPPPPNLARGGAGKTR